MEEYFNRAQEIIDLLSEDERLSWWGHPCTKALRLMVEGNVEELKNGWAEGEYTSNTTEETMLLTVRALGKVQGFDLILEHIEDIRHGENQEDLSTDSSGVHGSS